MEGEPLSQSNQTVLPSRGGQYALRVMPALLAGALLRIWMLRHFYEVTGDALIYGGIAKNLLLSGRYALTVGTGETYPTLIRLPGYPLYLAACFKVFGLENYAAAVWVQIGLELVGCVLLADFARRVTPPWVSRNALPGRRSICTVETCSSIRRCSNFSAGSQSVAASQVSPACSIA